MFATDALFGAGWPKTTYILPRNVSAIQVIPDEIGRIRLGTIVQLPEGAEVDICGEGFNDRTKKVAWQDGFYYLFTEDLDAKSDPPASLATAG